MESITSTLDSKWHSGIDARGLSTLSSAATRINALHHAARVEVTRAAIEIGRELQVAREVFAGDQQYGVWCADVFPWANRQTLYNMRALAEAAGTARLTEKVITALPLSNVFELVSAPAAVVRAIEERVDAGERPTVQQIRTAKREAAAPDPAPAPAETPSTPDPMPSTPPAPARPTLPAPAAPAVRAETTYHQWQLIINRPAAKRLSYYLHSKLTIETAYVVFGFDPNPCCYPSPFTVDAVYESFTLLDLTDAERAFAEAALALIEADREGFHAK